MRLIPFALLAALCATQSALAKPPDDPSFRLANRGKEPIAEFFATPSGKPNWGRNRLDGHRLMPGESEMFNLPRQEGCVWDLRVVFADGHRKERKDANLCRMSELPVP